MPKLSEINKLVTRKLPVSGVTVELQDCLNFEQSSELEAIIDASERGDRTLEMIVRSWNAYDDEDNLLEITKENLYKFPTPDVKWLFRYIMTDLVRPRTEDDVKDKVALEELAEQAIKSAQLQDEEVTKENPDETKEVTNEPQPEAETTAGTDTNVGTKTDDVELG